MKSACGLPAMGISPDGCSFLPFFGRDMRWHNISHLAGTDQATSTAGHTANNEKRRGIPRRFRV
jgi:hypothetical protein